MQTKLFEIRDAGTLIPAIATLMGSDDDAERWLLRRAGYGHENELVMLGYLEGGRPSNYDYYNWSDGTRTMRTAHSYIQEHWHELESGAVICVETILGERTTPQVSERLE